MEVKCKETQRVFSVKEFRYASHYDHAEAQKKMQRRKTLSNKKHANQILKLINI